MTLIKKGGINILNNNYKKNLNLLTWNEKKGTDMKIGK